MADDAFVRTHPIQQIFAHAQEPAPPIPDALEIEPALRRAVMSCLEKSPDARPTSVAELEEALRATDLAAGWTPARAAEWWRAAQPRSPEELALSPTVPA